ncbi:MAG: RNA 3'-terminal phosphate cyclase [Euryarchaeota archaeon]|nr:RNA 3'-terminal phosphate cyclase [Euryarchaeota archaeon]MBU4454276.1 RNA 3'-terminal phosphate cyclase [Euryarchaeota archaeon]MCG2738291.1 RNA 3'-terminal phosphate cyclase [Candidatus Methanoperedenaceae archaeon]
MKLDGSYGEGGGQILRTAVALSAVTGERVEINNIRKNRPKPGLSAQHVKAVESAAALCNGKVAGCKLHSTDLIFEPGKIKAGVFDIDIGTAGSITLILQCLMPIAMHSPGSVRLNISGGTDVSWSPTIDYLRSVTLGALSLMGCVCDIRLVRRGYYPRGGGCVEADIAPAALRKIVLETNECTLVRGISHSSRLPVHVAERQASSARDILKLEGYDADISIETRDDPSTGSGVTLWCGAAGGSALGKPGLKAETVGSIAAEALLAELRTGAGVDEFLADQLIPYMALAGGGSFTTGVISLHTRTNIWVTEHFLDVKFKIEEHGNGLFRVSV